MRTMIIAALIVATMPSLAAAQDYTSEMVIDFSKVPALHFPVGPNKQKVVITPAFEDYMYMFFDVCDAMKMTSQECNIYPMNGHIGGNAIATEVDGDRLIVYDRELSPIVGYEGAMAIIAHELAHHYCGHLKTPANPEQELVADRFAGAAMKNANMTLDSALAMADIFDERPSLSHPAKADRVEAIKAGWNEPETAKDCN